MLLARVRPCWGGIAVGRPPLERARPARARHGQVEMATVYFDCANGTHAIGVQTIEYSDANGLSFAPEVEYATSVGRADGYVARAEVATIL